ncbi:MAG: class I SAM-dependent methyltransferase [Patescibacteria group bacterium]|jgi:SAM-dependent methyltransferase
MPKQPQFESFRHQFLLSARIIAEKERALDPSSYDAWSDFIRSLEFKYSGSESVTVSWTHPRKGVEYISTRKLIWYFRGDTPDAVKIQKKKHLQFHEDKIQSDNRDWFLTVVIKISKKAGLSVSKLSSIPKKLDERLLEHFADEERLFDAWAKNTDPKKIDVIRTNEACTAPEMRYITQVLGNIKGKTLLDIGSGLGEASVYFALKGAHVTALDLSKEMLKTTQRIAKNYKTKVSTVQGAIEYLNLKKSQKFDVIYAGNVFHHINIPQALDQLLPHLKKDGTLVCWEPVDYNPVINLYRRIATSVRSKDERPIRLADIDVFHSYFKNVTVKWFWLTTLVIFCLMVVVMRRDPNKTRLWKKVVEEGNSWKPLYMPLEFADKILLGLFPILGPLCWNVVLVCRAPKTHKK